MITYRESDILKHEVKWVLGSITTNKASRGDGIPGELFQILKYDAVKVVHSVQFSSVNFCVQLFVTPWTEACQAFLSITNSQRLLKLNSWSLPIKMVMPSNHLIFCCPLLLPSIFLSIGVFSSDSVLHIRWPKY